MTSHIQNDVKPEFVPLTLRGRVYSLSLDLNLISLIQDRYGDLGAVFEKAQNILELRWLLWAFLNEAIEAHNDDFPEDRWERLTEEQTGRLIHAGNMDAVNRALLAAFGVSLPQAEDAGETEEKNGTAG